MSKNRETGTDIAIMGMKLVCLDHNSESQMFAEKRDLLIAKSHPLQWCSECKKG